MKTLQLMRAPIIEMRMSFSMIYYALRDNGSIVRNQM